MKTTIEKNGTPQSCSEIDKKLPQFGYKLLNSVQIFKVIEHEPIQLVRAATIWKNCTSTSVPSTSYHRPSVAMTTTSDKAIQHLGL